MVSLLVISPAFADDWIVLRLRGQVFTLDDGQWVQLQRGGIVSDDRIIRTSRNGKVTFVRGKEQIGLEPNTQIQIIDASGSLKTRVIQEFGTVSIEAERRNVQHFSVQTPFMAAVVKGTRFVVTSGEDGASVAVLRGVVQVTDRVHEVTTDITRGQSASAGTGADGVLQVKGPGSRHALVRADGTVVTRAELVAEAGEPARNGNAHGNGHGNDMAAGGNQGNGVSAKVTIGGGAVNAGIGVGHGNSNAGGNGSGHGNADGNGRGSPTVAVTVDVGPVDVDLRLGLGL